MAAKDDVLYAARIPIFPRSVQGAFRRFKTVVLLLAYGIYFALPWIPWERANAPAQSVVFDLEHQRFYLFNLIVHAQEIFLLAGVLMLFALSLFLVTGLFGRVFCGYFCFQTLWTDAFMFIERLVQGERPARIRLAKAAWGTEKLAKVGLTHLLWLLFAFWTGLTFTLYWGDARELSWAILTGTASYPAYFTTLLLTLTTYTMAGLAREQVCTYMCPYARFQAVMFDSNTLTVSYDRARGEGRAGRSKPLSGLKSKSDREQKGVGDCIDCGYCVQVCPTGIDIRNGLQYQCISCGLCVDACNTIMDRLDWPRGLVRYSSENAVSGKKRRLFKLQSVGYAIAIIIVGGFLTFGVMNKSEMEMRVRQVRQPLFVILSDGTIQNSYQIKVSNNTEQPMRIDLSLRGLPDAELDLGGQLGEQLELAPEQSLRLKARIKLPPQNSGQSAFDFVLSFGDSENSVIRPAVFYAP